MIFHYKYLGESKVLQYFGSTWGTTQNAFNEVMMMTNHTGPWDNELTWYSPIPTRWICPYGLEHGFEIHGLKPT